MKVYKVLILFCFFISIKTLSLELVIDHSQKKVKDNYIKSAHSIIEHKLSIDEVRFAILNGALTSKGVKWLLEEDSEGFFIFRWDFKGDVIYTKVEYDSQSIQLKYVNAFNDFVCENNVDGICYRNESRSYYRYVEALKLAIANAL